MPFQKLAREEALGRYRLIARLGQGGMADVFLARLVGSGGFETLVAVKRMLPTLSDDRRFVAMFLNEGRIAAQLDHPNVCHVYELDEADGTLFLAMEFLRGLPWSEVVPMIPDRPVTTLARFVTGVIVQACEGLHHAHTAVGIDGQPRPIVHRDVSPANLFVTNEGIVKLLDFGVSKVLTEASVTASGVLKGKLPYLSPEQVRNMPVDARTDLFSLAVVAWEALAGRALFDRASAYETVIAVAETDIPTLPGDDAVTRRLDAVLRRALARDPTHRHRSARELADDLCRASAACGAPMTAFEIHAHVSTWLGPSLLRHGRDLAALLGGGRQLDDLSDEQTRQHAAVQLAGMRLREVSVTIGNNAHGTAQPIESIPVGSSTIIGPAPAPITNASGAAMIAPSDELTIPYFAAANTVQTPGVAVVGPTTKPTKPGRRRVTIPNQVAPIGRLGSRTRSLALLVIAILAMEAGVVVGRLLA